MAMTLRYSHLSPARQLDAVQRLNREPTATTTATDEPTPKRAAAGGVEVLDKRSDWSAPGVSRTPDLQVRSLTLYPTELRARGDENRT